MAGVVLRTKSFLAVSDKCKCLWLHGLTLLSAQFLTPSLRPAWRLYSNYSVSLPQSAWSTSIAELSYTVKRKRKWLCSARLFRMLPVTVRTSFCVMFRFQINAHGCSRFSCCNCLHLECRHSHGCPQLTTQTHAPWNLTWISFCLFLQKLSLRSVLQGPVGTKCHGAVSNLIIIHNGTFVLPPMLTSGVGALPKTEKICYEGSVDGVSGREWR
jgi:hypothetical protein